MSFSERRINPRDKRPDYGEGGGIRRALRRIFVEGDDFFSWALPLFTIGGVRVRVHLLYILFVIVRLLQAVRLDTMGFSYEAWLLGSMFVFVLLHEFGHVITCRA